MAFSAARAQRRAWDRRAGTWDHGGAQHLTKVVDAVIEAADASAGKVAVDLGAGTGQLTLPLARTGVRVTAVDISSEMIRRLEAKAQQDGLDGVEGMVAPIEGLQMAPNSLDLVVSNYTLHHLRDRDKEAIVHSVFNWLRPGGRFVVGDMMFGRGGSDRDRAIIGSKLAVLARRGPAGWWRILKNVMRFSLRMRERPVSAERWTGYFEEAGLVDVTCREVVAEAAVVVGRKP